MKSTNNENVLNKNIICNDSIGRIKYVGLLEDGTGEIWYGIEWRDPTRGKHDGSHKGKQYFSTNHPKSGSFVRPNKVDFGVSIWQAILNKYYDEDEVKQLQNTEDKDRDHFLYNNFNLLEKKVSINCINLAGHKISNLDGINNLVEQFPSITEFDVEMNLINSWNQVFQILDLFKNLRILNISNNLLDFDDLDSAKKYPNIKHLVMNRMGFNWNDICRVVKHFPSLVELKICFNQIDKLGEIDTNLINNIKILDLEANPIPDWNELKKLGILKELEYFFINGVGLQEIFFDDCKLSEKTHLFPKLKSISLNENKIDNWKTINSLNQLKSLEEIRLKFNPINTMDTKDNLREIFIAKLEKVKLFNRTPITNNEKKGAEIDYLKLNGKEWIELEEGKDSNGQPITPEDLASRKARFHLEHPRYSKLVEIYGPPEKSELKGKPETLKSNLISLNIKNELTGEMLNKKLPMTIDIQRLKSLISKLFKSSSFDFESLRLFYVNSKNPTNEYELDNDFRTLGFYGIENDDTIIARKL